MKRYETRCSAWQLDEQVEDRGLHRDVERRGRLVADDELRVARERAGDRDALLEAAGELHRLLRQRALGEPNPLGQLATRASAAAPVTPASFFIDRSRMRCTE